MISNEELYYRRAYRIINKLIDNYKDGFNKNKTYKMWYEEYMKSIENYSLVKTGRDATILTIAIALMGLNKEKLEDSKKLENYDNDLVSMDVRQWDLNTNERKTIEEFDCLKTTNSVFDKWLTLINSPESDKTSLDVLKRVRNGLLHSNFTIDTSNKLFTLTDIKTKSYYESKILNDNFMQFILAYFSNHAEMGVPEKTITYVHNKNIIVKDEKSLRKFLESIIILNFKSKSSIYNRTNTLDYLIFNSLEGNKVNFNQTLHDIQNTDIVIEKVDPYTLSKVAIDNFINKLMSSMPNLFELSDSEIKNYVVTGINYCIDPIREVSNMLLHYHFIMLNLVNKNFDINTEFFKGDEYAIYAYKPSLMILKLYLVLYRLQNNAFDEINYDDIDFDYKPGKDSFYCYNIKNPKLDVNYFEESFEKLQKKYPNVDEDTITKKIFLEIIRNSLAHGNIIPKINDNSEPVIEFKDIFKDRVRSLILSIDTIENLLNSKAFEPKYCYKKEEKTLTK